MDIAGYELRKDLTQIITFKRKNIEESGKKDVRFLVWDQKDPKFGIADEHFQQYAGISVKDNKRIITQFLDNVVAKGEATTCYRYIGAREDIGTGYLQEVIPEICETKKIDASVLPQFKAIRDYIEKI